MAQRIITTTPVNSGLGTPINEAFDDCNDNFSELYSRAQTAPPSTLTGSIGDQAGMYAYDSNYFYYCYQDYDGSSIIWAQISEIGNVSVSQIQSGTSNIAISNINGNIVVSVAGTNNVATFKNTGLEITANVSAGNVIGTAIYGGLATANQPNITQVGSLTSVTVTGNATAGNVLSSGVISTTANVVGANINSSGQFLATGNITGGNIVTPNTVVANNVVVTNEVSAVGNIVTDGYFVGTFFGNVTGNFVVPGANTQVLFNTAGNADAVNKFTFNKDTDVLTVTGTINTEILTANTSITTAGNVSAGNVLVSSAISAAGNIVTGAQLSATGNITGGNLAVTAVNASRVTATGNITGGNVLSAGIVSSTGNITGGNVIGGGVVSLSNITGGNALISGIISATSNITGGNALIGGIVSATSNVTGGNLITSGSISAGSDASIGGLISVAGNVTGGNLITSGQVIATGNVSGGNLLMSGTASAVGNITGGNLSIGGSSSIAGNVTGGNLITNGLLSVTGTITGGNTSVGTLSASGNVTGLQFISNNGMTASGNIVTTGTLSINSSNNPTAITNSGSNGAGNIGSASRYFNTVYATSTSALYADIAERYQADAEYEPGTVVSFGGSAEVTLSTHDGDTAVAGVISTRPAYQMNAGLESEHVAVLALLGRVPCRVVGPVRKGDLLVSAGNGQARSERAPNIGSVIGKAVENFDGDQGTIEIVVGRL